MAKYEIPEVFQAGFKLINVFDNKSLEKVIKIIESADVGDQPEDLVSKSDFSPLDQKDLSVILRAVYTLTNFLIETDKQSSIVLADIVVSYFEQFPEQKEKSKLLENLEKIIFSNSKVTQTVKGYNLLSEGEKVFIKSRIISDVRLIFDTNIETKTKGAVLIHQLKLTYRESNDWKEIFVTLDSNDLASLKESISRAIEKEKLITSNTFTKDLSFLKPKK